MTHDDFVRKLGTPSEIAEWLSKESHKKVDRESVYKWATNGIPWRWRPFLAKLARQKGVTIPKDVWPGVAA